MMYRLYIKRAITIVLILFVIYILYFVLKVKVNSAEIRVDKMAPLFQAVDITGKTSSIQDLRGKYVVLNFWTTWCKDCREEMPELQKAYVKYKDLGLEIVGINVGETEIVAATISKQYCLTFPIWRDKNKEVANLYNVVGIPTTIFINPQGVITHIKITP